MKRIVLILISVALLLPRGSCNKEFSYRGSRFGDSMEQVRKAEGGGGKTGEDDDYQIISFEREIYDGFTGNFAYFFEDDELKIILGIFSDIENISKMHIEDIYRDLKQSFIIYGNPSKEKSLEYSIYQALWEKDGYGIALSIADKAIVVASSSDPGRVKRFFDTHMFTSLFSDTDETGIKGYILGPDEYNDPYDISSFIPLPEKGCDYIVRNSIKEEEMSILNSSPSIQQLISVFGYPPFAIMIIDPVTKDRGKMYEKEYYMQYLVEDNKLDVIFNEDCSLKEVYYNKRPLIKFPESNKSSAEKPVDIVRNDISRDELSFINTETTPEELQHVLGAPHRECYNDKLFRRVGFDYIRFFMSRYFLYPLKDGGVLEVHYSPGTDKAELNVASAVIYDDDGQETVLVDRNQV